MGRIATAWLKYLRSHPGIPYKAATTRENTELDKLARAGLVIREVRASYAMPGIDVVTEHAPRTYNLASGGQYTDPGTAVTYRVEAGK